METGEINVLHVFQDDYSFSDKFVQFCVQNDVE